MSADDIEAIKSLKYEYLRALDNHDWQAYAACFTEDATSAFGSELAKERLVFEGRDSIVGGIADSMDFPLKVSMHQVHHPEIEMVDDASAKGSWYLMDEVVCEAQKWMVKGAAYYKDEYRKVDGKWLISHTGYERHFEYVTPLPEGFKMTAMSETLKAAAERTPPDA